MIRKNTVSIFPVMEKKLTDKAFSLLLYWLLFASFTFSDFYAERIMGFVPFYWVIKVRGQSVTCFDCEHEFKYDRYFFDDNACIYCIYLYLPQTEGINIVEEKIILPALQKFAKKLKREVP
ncbi:unnamed protein product [Brugia pahangi]|uniref:Zn_Tnp_IS91 domain-containing protein n=1 Tax=Brugia pahangi TaxID=6280 RepID=A0A0N4SZE1_BRUPA|nr:unnamed protein product [Brugia pahangi]